MKRIKFLSICYIAVSLLTACGSSSSKNEEEKISVTGADGKEYTSYQDACTDEDFEAAHKFLDILYKKYIEGDGETQYHAALNYIFKQEMMFLASDGSEETSDRIIYLLTEIPQEGSPLKDGTYFWTEISKSDEGKEHLTYSKWITNYNSLCSQIIDLAISQNNQYLAQKVIKMYKKNVESEKMAIDTVMGDYEVTSTWADKEAAIAKCKEANIMIE